MKPLTGWLLTEQAPTLQITDVDLNQYALSLLDRFANPALKHKTWQIAMDGSQKYTANAGRDPRAFSTSKAVAAVGARHRRLDALRERWMIQALRLIFVTRSVKNCRSGGTEH